MLKKSLSRWCKVRNRNANDHSWLYWLIGGVTVIALVLLISVHDEHQVIGVDKRSLLSPRQYQNQLNQNLRRLQQLNKAKPKLTKLINTVESRINSTINKAYKIRQNAPTSMYSSHRAANVAIKNSEQKSNVFAGRGHDSRFANNDAVTTTVAATRISHPQYTVASGELLHAVLETAINSDLPGLVRAVVSSPVYSYTGEQLLISAGSRLVGQYTSAVVRGQKRVMVIWNRVIRPDGVSLQLNSPGTDALGRAGQTADSVNTHFMARFSQAALLSLLSAGAASIGVANNDRYNSVSQYRSAISESMQQAAKQSLQDNVTIKPTIHVHQGATINVFVAHDLSLYNVLQRDYK
ncbi:MAG: TrbI/VirB10 family protein [Coxiellaceae bacterium]|nr:TrbI/VirB10 family protein [Coxiellaceae bacterium]